MEAYRLYTYQTTRKPQPQSAHTMSDITLADLKFIKREDLSQNLLSSSSSPQLPPNIAIIDVRDSDHVGGHIRGSTWVPSSELDYKTPELVRTLKDKEKVIFHCALSQQRGPSAALRYLREKRRLDPESKAVSEGEVEEGAEKEQEGEKVGKEKKQEVLVLEGGFTKWQEKYGEDKRLTEGYQKDIWEFGY
jgi:rhodanese-related sulfurtransferase